MNFIEKHELDELKNDQNKYTTELWSSMNNMKDLLKGELGKDIDEVLSGKRVIKLTLYERIKYKIRHFFDVLFRVF